MKTIKTIKILNKTVKIYTDKHKIGLLFNYTKKELEKMIKGDTTKSFISDCFISSLSRIENGLIYFEVIT